ncbi:MAG: hypothetical protein M1839_000655 [Geoglossum umbratile]|nr:MAG: hypothetical protein M1839_000655 [Geoglossum umbratile]
MFSVEVNILTDISGTGGSVLKFSVELDSDKVYDASCYSKSDIITVGLNVHLGEDSTASASRESLVTTIEDDEVFYTSIIFNILKPSQISQHLPYFNLSIGDMKISFKHYQHMNDPLQYLWTVTQNCIEIQIERGVF